MTTFTPFSSDSSSGCKKSKLTPKELKGTLERKEENPIHCYETSGAGRGAELGLMENDLRK